MSIREGFRRRAWYSSTVPWYTHYPKLTKTLKYPYRYSEEYVEDKIFAILEKRSKKFGKICIDIEVPDNIIHILHELADVTKFDYNQKIDLVCLTKSYYFRNEEEVPYLCFSFFFNQPHLLTAIVPITLLDNYFKGNRLQIRESEYHKYLNTMDLYFEYVYKIKQLPITEKEFKTLKSFHQKVKQIKIEKTTLTHSN